MCDIPLTDKQREYLRKILDEWNRRLSTTPREIEHVIELGTPNEIWYHELSYILTGGDYNAGMAGKLNNLKMAFGITKNKTSNIYKQ